MFLLLGLGNPGPKYLLTRHNVGFRAVDKISAAAKIPLYKAGHHAFWGKGRVAGQDVVLAKPMTFMNNSGLAAAGLCRAFGILPENLLVIYDDLDLPAGAVRLRPQGGSGGHNGIKSITLQMQTDGFPRLRLGIGRRPTELDAADYVLQEFSAHEEEVLAEALDTAVKASFLFVREGITAAMNRYNTTSKKMSLLSGEDMLN
ncbi:MAG: aminoacyl-tRNA hydrolase [Bacillota bacterium]|nr:aminoacyl-tRNA hydrolase [Bacillota bacterium]MDW7683048.1 aminoacyl-tRNA hydrolase [Bacillota bacterium]